MKKEKENEKDKEKALLQPSTKLYMSDEQGRDNFKYDLNENFEHRSTYSKYNPTKEVKEVRLAEEYVKRREKEAREKREDEEMVGMMSQWSQYKGRMEKEMNRRVESATYGHQFQEVEMKARADKEGDREELEKIRKKHEEVLSRPADFDEDLHLSDLSEEELQIQEVRSDYEHYGST